MEASSTVPDATMRLDGSLVFVHDDEKISHSVLTIPKNGV